MAHRGRISTPLFSHPQQMFPVSPVLFLRCTNAVFCLDTNGTCCTLCTLFSYIGEIKSFLILSSTPLFCHAYPGGCEEPCNGGPFLAPSHCSHFQVWVIQFNHFLAVWPWASDNLSVLRFLRLYNGHNDTVGTHFSKVSLSMVSVNLSQPLSKILNGKF